MAIYLAVNEPGDMNFVQGDVNNFSRSTSTGYKNSWSRESWYARVSQNLANGMGSAPALQLSSDLNEGWFHFVGWWDNRGDYINVNTALMDTAGNFLCGITREVAGMGFRSHVHGVDIVAADGVDEGLKNWDIHFRINAVDGFFRCYVDGVLRSEFVGDTATGRTDARYVALARCYDIASTGYYFFRSELIVSDQNTIGARLYTADLLSDGTDQDWTGVVGDTNHREINDGTFIAATTNGNQDSYNLNVPGSLEAGHVIAGISFGYRAQTQVDSLVSQIQPYLNIGGTRYNIGSPITPPTGSVTGYWEHTELNPADMAAFELADLTGMELGFRALT